jgi:glycosyltransferase involved in cell wall biosynthesis
LQYLPFLKELGLQVDVHSFYQESYLKYFYQKGYRNWSDMLASYLKRADLMKKLRNYDLIWIEKEIFPWLPALLEKYIHRVGIPYVVDYDDAIFHKYDLHSNRIVRRVLGRKIDTVMACAELVIAGNRYLSKRARVVAGAKNVLMLPTVIDLSRYQMCNIKDNTRFTIGWIGSPTTAVYLKPVLPLLRELRTQLGIRIVLVGASQDQFPYEPFEFLSWSENSEVKSIQTFDVGIMPLPDTPWAKGKCGYKLIQYMACGVPVVASDIGANKDIIDHGQQGFLTTTLKDWYEAIKALYSSADLRKSMSHESRDRVEKRYHLGVTAPVLEKHLRRVASHTI